MARKIGMHIRLNQGLLDIIPVVETLKIEVAQSFLMLESNAHVLLNDKIVSEFIKAKQKLGFLYYVHAAYWSGVTDSSSKMFASLQREVSFAQRLQSDGIVIHCGAIKSGSLSKYDQKLYVAESINKLHHDYPGIKLVLENTPHAGKSFGGNLQDFALIMEHVEKKDLVAFCIDTAHAFVYGYDISKLEQQLLFVQEVEDLLGAEHIALLHLNDSQDRCGSYIDKHAAPGDGLIGLQALQNIMHASVFAQVPILIELPGNCLKKDQEILDLVRSL